jgi:CheY-like chemotaxis protein
VQSLCHWHFNQFRWTLLRPRALIRIGGGGMLESLRLHIKLCRENAAEARGAAGSAESTWRRFAQSFCLNRYHARAADRRPTSVAAPPAHRDNGKPLISIVDDDETVRRAMKRLIQSLGYDAATFATAQEYLLSQRLRDTACLISDVQMPGLSGLDLQACLIAEGHSIPIIFITGFPDERIRARALQSGAFGFLTKPCHGKLLIECLEKALAGVTRPAEQ